MKITKDNLVEPAPPKRVLHANSYPQEGFSLLVDGRFKSHYVSSDEATRVGLTLKEKYPFLQITVRDAITTVRNPVELPVA